MTYQNNSTLSPEILEAISEQGLEFIPELIRIIVEEFHGKDVNFTYIRMLSPMYPKRLCKQK